MTIPRRSFTDAFKREAVPLSEACGRPFEQIANELGMAASVPRNRRNAAGVLAVAMSGRLRSRAFAARSNGCAPRPGSVTTPTAAANPPPSTARCRKRTAACRPGAERAIAGTTPRWKAGSTA
jgi:transposase-like protein